MAQRPQDSKSGPVGPLGPALMAAHDFFMSELKRFEGILTSFINKFHIFLDLEIERKPLFQCKTFDIFMKNQRCYQTFKIRSGHY